MRLPFPIVFARRIARRIAAVVVVASLALAQAAEDPIVVGVITSRSGGASAAGSSQALAATAWASRLRAAGGVFGVPVELRLADDQSVPRRARDEAEALVADGAHVLVCCTTAAASYEVASVAETAGVALLAPTALVGFGAPAAAPYWAFGLAPSETDALAAVIADAHRAGVSAIALMTLDNAFGASTLEAARALAEVAGMRVAAEVTYAPGTVELRPEALWVATRQPGAVIVWGLADDLEVAVSALRRRGYEGAIYGRSALLLPGVERPSLGSLAEVRFAVPPALVSASLPSGADCGAETAAAAAMLAAVPAGLADLASSAPVLDALDLVRAAAEQVIALNLPDVSLAAMRQALRDALVALPERCGANGITDLLDGRGSAAVPRGLAIGMVTQAGLVAVR